MSVDGFADDLFGWHPSPPTVPAGPAHYPTLPGHKGPEGGPSHEAAQKIAPKVTGRRKEVLDFLQKRATAPMTADAIAVALNRSPFGVRPRVAELHAMGLIEPDTTRGKNESGMSAHRWRPVTSLEQQARS